VLAAEEPLSLQAHPSAAQAATGFAREEALRLPPDAPERNYRDSNAKPELICALTELHALVGFREAQCSVELLRALAVDKLATHVELLAADPGPSGLRALFTTWITLPQAALDELMPALQDGCVRLAQDPGGRFRDEARTVLDLSERYPGDAGVLAALLLNRITLAPGEALFLAAGNLHSYQSGAGIELQASSDNVLRGGLTPKHVDVPELLRVLDFRSGPPVVLRGVPDGPWTRYDTPAEEFRLYRLDRVDTSDPPHPVDVPDGGPRILLCTDGAVRATVRGSELTLCRGRSLWLPDSDHGVRVLPAPGRTQLFLACDGL
jgi:mannose-6-phosphate isomerase